MTVTDTAPTVTPVLEAQGLSKRYGAFAAVRDINLSIRPGEILGVLGPNGAGKSTIVKMVTGLIKPSRGAVFFRGKPITENLGRFKRSLGYVPEQPDLYDFLTGWEYLDLVATLRGLQPRIFREKSAALLQGLSLYSNRDNPISSYSKGMRQRVVLVAALLHDPELLILDEPFSGLDVTSALIMREVIELLAARGKAVFFSSPVLEQVERLCSHLALLKRGSLVAAGTFAEMQAGFAGLSLEDGFMQLTEQTDAGKIARDMVAAVTSPST